MKTAIVAGCRTPFLRSGTDFEDLSAIELGKVAVREALARSGVQGERGGPPRLRHRGARHPGPQHRPRGGAGRAAQDGTRRHRVPGLLQREPGHRRRHLPHRARPGRRGHRRRRGLPVPRPHHWCRGSSSKALVAASKAKTLGARVGALSQAPPQGPGPGGSPPSPSPPRARPWARPPSAWPRRTASAARTRTRGRSARTSSRRRGWPTAASPRRSRPCTSLRSTRRWSPRTTASAPTRTWRRWPSCGPCSTASTARSRRATPRRSPTVRRPWCS